MSADSLLNGLLPKIDWKLEGGTYQLYSRLDDQLGKDSKIAGPRASRCLKRPRFLVGQVVYGHLIT